MATICIGSETDVRPCRNAPHHELTYVSYLIHTYYPMTQRATLADYKVVICYLYYNTVTKVAKCYK